MCGTQRKHQTSSVCSRWYINALAERYCCYCRFIRTNDEYRAASVLATNGRNNRRPTLTRLRQLQRWHQYPSDPTRSAIAVASDTFRSRYGPLRLFSRIIQNTTTITLLAPPVTTRKKAIHSTHPLTDGFSMQRASQLETTIAVALSCTEGSAQATKKLLLLHDRSYRAQRRR